VLGSNVFNLAALLGLGAVVAGGIALHRRVVALEGVIGVWVAAVALLTVLHVTSPAVGLVLVLAALVPYVVLAGLSSNRRRDRLATTRVQRWLRAAMAEEELELSAAIHPRRGRSVDLVVGSIALAVVVTASVVMERAASTLGRRFSVPDIVVGTLVLAAVTSLPNAVAAVYLARRGRGAASLSTALNSNAINVAAGLLVPAVILTTGPITPDVSLVASWYAGLTVLIVAFAYLQRGLRPAVGALIVTAYLAFAATVAATGSRTSAAGLATYLLPPVLIVTVSAVLLLWPVSNRGDAQPPPPAGEPGAIGVAAGSNGSAPKVPRPGLAGSLLVNWSVTRLWLLAVIISSAVAACDALLGRRVILMGLLIVGPCCALLTGRWRPAALAGAWALLLAVPLAIPDGIWATPTQAAFLAAITVVSVTATSAAALIQRQHRPAA
jgi:cation:H+ antiporter